MDLAEATRQGEWLYLWQAGPDSRQIPNLNLHAGLLLNSDCRLPEDHERISLLREHGCTELDLLPTARARQFLPLPILCFSGDRIWFYWQVEVAVQGGATWRKPVVAVEINGSVTYTTIDRTGKILITKNPDAVPCNLE